jgi:transcriptional regulator with XRE-family HTH domain
MSGVRWSLTAEEARLIRETIGRNIRRERELAGLRPGDLADRSGVSRNTIWRMEEGKQEPRLTTMIALAFALDAPVKVLLVDLPTTTDARGSGR